MMRARTALLGLAGFIIGWALVFISGYGGNSTGGSELVWQIAGLMIYASLFLLAVAAVAALVFLAYSGLRQLRHRATRLS